jgi:hypothetical protein
MEIDTEEFHEVELKPVPTARTELTNRVLPQSQ